MPLTEPFFMVKYEVLIITKIENPYDGSLSGTGKSFSEALILASVNPQYDERLFIEFQEKYKFTTCYVQILS